MSTKIQQSKTYTLFLIATALLLFPFLILFTIRNSVSAYPETIHTAQKFCINGTFFLPQIYKVYTSIPSEIEINNKVKILDKIEILSKEICIKPIELLPEHHGYTVNLGYFGNSSINIFQQQIELTTSTHPTVQSTSLDESITRNEIISFDTTYDNNFIEYALLIGDTSIQCNKENTQILCDTNGIPFEYGKTYTSKLLGMYEGNTVKILDSKEITILYPVTVESSSIQNKEVIQTLNIPDILITLNKEIKDNYKIQFTNQEQIPIPFNTVLEGNILHIQPQKLFKQQNTYTITILEMEGIDGSKTENKYTLEFSIDDGPKVKGTNLKTGFGTGDNISLSFNQDIKMGEDITKYIKITPLTDYSYVIKRNQITINPIPILNLCTPYRIDISKGLTSTNGLVSSKASSYTFKTTCHRVTTLGTSVQGRGIYAYYFGNGSKKILFFGSMHGSESNTKTTMTKWIDELEINNSRIPLDKTVIVIPAINPDGIANRTRFNANGVDLNRNFPATDWAQGTYLGTNYYPMGGGLTPFSEPESILLKNFLISENPYISLSYHSAAGYVVPSNTSRGTELGQTYSKYSGYRYITPGTHDAFSYDITGTFEGWAEEQGYSSLVIELSSAYSDQFAQNKEAMWKMVESY